MVFGSVNFPGCEHKLCPDLPDHRRHGRGHALGAGGDCQALLRYGCARRRRHRCGRMRSPAWQRIFPALKTRSRRTRPTWQVPSRCRVPHFCSRPRARAPLQRAEFLCGIFGAQGQTRDSAVFVIPNLPPGNYGDRHSGRGVRLKGAYTVSFVLQQQGADWKLGGFYAKLTQIAGHDGNWFADRAREFKAKGQNHNAWFYYGEARELLVPVPFMATATTDRLYDEMQTVKPADLPPADLTAGGKDLQTHRSVSRSGGPRLRPGGEVPMPRMSPTAGALFRTTWQ